VRAPEGGPSVGPVPAWSDQIALYVAAYLGYGATRWLVISDPGAAVGHARAIARLERGLHVAVEGSVQRALAHTPVMWVLGGAYLAAQVVVVPAVLVAAVPSLHCGFALAVSAALVSASRRWWPRALAAAWTPLIVLAVDATGNHFRFDVVVGLAVTTAGYGVGSIGRSSP
jgi:hypothetical protein